MKIAGIVAAFKLQGNDVVNTSQTGEMETERVDWQPMARMCSILQIQTKNC